jgi:hypothetical protein
MKTNKQHKQMWLSFYNEVKRKPKANNQKKKLIKQIREKETKTQLELPYEF